MANLKEVSDYLDSVRIPIRLACKTESGWPVVISLWFLHQDGKLFCATQSSAKVVSYLSANPEVGFEIAADHPPYCGVRGQARARIEPALGREILERLLERYLGGTESKLAKDLLAKSDTEVAIVLDPVQVFSWNFSARMKDVRVSGEEALAKVCP